MKALNLIFFVILFFLTKLGLSQTQASSKKPVCGIVVIPNADFDQCSYDEWILAFSDDFDGYQLDNYKWEAFVGVPRDPSFGLQKAWHKRENIQVDNGLLKIVAKKEFNDSMPVTHSYNPLVITYVDFNYTTGEIWSKNEFSFGRFIARVKLPSGNGLFPAFWLYSEGNGYNEIDIFEFFGEESNPKTYQTNVHVDCDKDGNVDNKSIKQNDGTNYSQGFHIFEVVWEKDRITWLIDGIERRIDFRYTYINGSQVGCRINGFQQYIMNLLYPLNPMSIILNLAIRSKDHVPSGYDFPVKMEIDWVRYFKRGTCYEEISYQDLTRFTFNPLGFNSITGYNVSLGGGFKVPSNHQLDVLAEDHITLSAGFEVSANSFFLAEITSPICGGADLKKAFNPSGINSTGDKTQIDFYPNPVSETVTMNYDGIGYEGINVMILNSTGKVVKKYNNIKDSRLKINLSGYPSGVYMVKIFDLTTQILYTYPIVLM